jgi:protein gp37
MTADSAIEWTDHTFSPWLGCTPVSAACDNCYAAALAERYGWPAYRKGVPRRLSAPSTWKLPRRWQRKAAANGVRARVFPSLCDPYDKEVSDDWRDDLMEEIEATPDLDWLLLTKRPQVAKRYHRRRRMPANVALGVTAENQAMANLRLPTLLSIDGPKLRFVSIEPALGPTDLTAVRIRGGYINALAGLRYADDGSSAPVAVQRHRLDWIIPGGESGPRARVSDPAVFRALRDQCLRYGTAFFFKQWGEHAPADANGRMVRVGKKAAGAELDGRLWRQLPPQLQQGQGATA